MQYDEKSRFPDECGMLGCHGESFAELHDHVETPAKRMVLCESCLLRTYRIKRNSTDVYHIETGREIPLRELQKQAKRLL